jgi:hypothetical protein
MCPGWRDVTQQREERYDECKRARAKKHISYVCNMTKLQKRGSFLGGPFRFFKGSLIRDFSITRFFHELVSPGPLVIPWGHYKFLQKLAEVRK